MTPSQFAFTAYATSDVLGSPGKVYDLLVQAAKDHPVSGNAGGSYLTMRSKEGAIFFVINIVGNFGTVFLDNGYYNKGKSSFPQDLGIFVSSVFDYCTLRVSTQYS